MESLSGANFDFTFACPHKPYHTDCYKHVEHLMLSYFLARVGGQDSRYRFPLLNSNAGSDRKIPCDDERWNAPLRSNGERPLWAIKPTSHSDFAPLD